VGSPSADETYLKVQGRWCYLYRAIDRDGNLIDRMLSAARDMRAAPRFFRSARSVAGFAEAGDNRWSQLLFARDPLDAGPQRLSRDECLPEQSTSTGPSRDQRTDPMYAWL
jgi:hypothetical protein